MLIEVRHLRVVEAIQATGSVSRAGERLHLTQPAVSHALRDLEDRLGVRLFERQTRRMLATPAGLRLLESASIVLDELRGLELELGEHRDGRRGRVRLATGCYTCYFWLPRLLAAFEESWPGVDVELKTEATAAPLQALLAGQLDLALVQCEIADARLQSEPLFEDELVAVMAPGHRLAKRSWVAAEDFADETLVIHSHPDTTYLIQGLMRPAGIEPRRVLQLQITQAVVEAVAAGLGVSTLARWVAEPELRAGRLRAVRLTRAGVKRQWSAVWSRRRRPTPALEELVSLLKRDAFAAADCCALPAVG